MQKIAYIFSIAFVALFLLACEETKKGPTDTMTSGSINIAVDETYRPIIEEQLKVFDSSFPETNIKSSFKSESDCIKDFLNDSARLILVTRQLSPDEAKFLEQKKVVATSLAIAKDAVAVILNNSSTDSVFSISQIKEILTGSYGKKYTVVFDNQGSSTLRYMLDSLIAGEKLGTNVFAAKSNDSVIDYVSKNPDAIGFVGVSYVSDFTDPEGLAFIKKVKVAEVFNEKLGKSYAPYQAYIAPNWYPLTRRLYYIHRETYPALGTGFANFLAKERGQLIFKQARLFPLRSDVIFREADLAP
ncbi:MAG TPA: substrate-binding domain-containing protein [Flavipsychrobacter sp.]|nr:substrate-binding domain-containing protein [Flavipsychrobacter sp.]